MASCERCWNESGGNHKEYMELLKINNCTPEEQAGRGANMCRECGRATVHIYTHRCMSCNALENSEGA